MAASARSAGVSGAPLLERYATALAAAAAPAPGSDALAKARLCVADYFASALAAAELPWSRQAVAAARRHPGAAGNVAIVGTAHVAAPREAAFANAVLGHALVRDDMHLGSVSHLGTVVIPAALSLAARRAVTGLELLRAVAIGYEAGGRLGRLLLDVDVAKTHRPTGLTGPFAAAAAGAALLGLDRPAFAAALAIAANTAAGYNEWASTGGSEMFFHPGFAARNALTALDLAAAGAHASATALDGGAGMLAAYGKPPPAADTPLPFETGAEILAVFFKEVPACNYAQTAAQVARDLAASGVDASAIERVTARVPYAAAHYPGCDDAGPFAHVLQCKMSIQYNVASALVHGNFDESNYRPAEQPAVLDLARRVAVEIDDALTAAYPAAQGAALAVTLRCGETLRGAAADVLPADAATVERRLAAAATARLGERGARPLLDLVAALESATDAGRLLELARRHEGGGGNGGGGGGGGGEPTAHSLR